MKAHGESGVATARLLCRGFVGFLSMSRVKRLLLTSRTFFVTVNLRKNLAKFTEEEFSLLLAAMEESRRKLSFSLYGYVLMPDH